MVAAGWRGALAQLGERLICIQEVRSSILLGSTMPVAGWPRRSGHIADLIGKPWCKACPSNRAFASPEALTSFREINIGTAWFARVWATGGIRVLRDSFAAIAVLSKVKYTNQTCVRFEPGRMRECTTSDLKPPDTKGGGQADALRLLDRIKREKGVWWMPWQQEAMKDVLLCDKPWGAEKRL